jgi:hypothetical protein
MQSHKRKSISTCKHTYTGTMVKIASKHYKYAILKQSESKSKISWVNPHSRTWRCQCRVYFLLYENRTIPRSWHSRSKMHLTPPRIILISSRRSHNLSLLHGLWAVLILIEGRLQIHIKNKSGIETLLFVSKSWFWSIKFNIMKRCFHSTTNGWTPLTR